MLNNQFQQSADEVLRQAAAKEDIDGVKEALKTSGITQKAKNSTLWFAATQGYTEIANLIEEAGADYQMRLNGDLNCAAAQGRIKDIESLLEKGADLKNNRYFPLKMAIYNNQLAAAQLLHQKGGHLTETIGHFEQEQIWEWKNFELIAWVSETLADEAANEAAPEQQAHPVF